jgi:hypothetical protein
LLKRPSSDGVTHTVIQEAPHITFQVPDFGFWNVCFTMLGASVYWFKVRKTDVKAFAMSELIRMYIKNEKVFYPIEFLVFIALGTVIGIAFVQPVTPQHAVTAGMAWTSMLTLPGEVSRRRTR